MRKILSLLIFFLFVATTLNAGTKIDPTFNSIHLLDYDQPSGELAAKLAGVKFVGSERYVDAFIKTTDHHLVEMAVIDAGGSINRKLGTILVVSIPLNSVEELAALDEVIYIEASKRVRPMMNEARAVCNVDTVQSGGGSLSQAYKGDDVVIGIVDSGVDCTHSDFADRIVAYWDIDSDKTYTTSEILAGDCYNALSSDAYHGTHVAGIAAGADSVYTGIAPEASIAVSQLPSSATTTNVIEGINFVFDKAESSLLPAVANLSVGTSLGPHDGTSLFETSLDATVTGKKGRSVVCAAGNENVNTNDSEAGFTLGGLHGAVDIDTGGDDIGYEAILRSLGTAITMDIWLDSGSACSVELAAYTSGRNLIGSTGTVNAGSSGTDIENNITLSVDFTDDDNTLNGKQHAQAIASYSGTSTYDPTAITYDLIIRNNGSGCEGDVWMYLDLVSRNVFTSNRDGTASPAAATSPYTYSKGDGDKMTTIPSTAGNCISVGSFSARNTWEAKDGTHNQNVYDTSIGATGTEEGEISLFSSHGPGASTTASAARQKPNITAPGEPIISTLTGNCGGACQTSLGGNSVIAPDEEHLKLEGTSMASPYIAGIVALLFQKNHCLTYSEVMSSLQNNTTSVSGTTLPNYVWGYGKVNALAAIQAVPEDTTCVPDNSSSSSSGCSLISDNEDNKIKTLFIFLFLIFPITVICFNRLKTKIKS